jgi:hypothetical protein
MEKKKSLAPAGNRSPNIQKRNMREKRKEDENKKKG